MEERGGGGKIAEAGEKNRIVSLYHCAWISVISATIMRISPCWKDRRFYVNLRTPDASGLHRKVSKALPRSQPCVNLYEFSLPEQQVGRGIGGYTFEEQCVGVVILVLSFAFSYSHSYYSYYSSYSSYSSYNYYYRYYFFSFSLLIALLIVILDLLFFGMALVYFWICV